MVWARFFPVSGNDATVHGGPGVTEVTDRLGDDGTSPRDGVMLAELHHLLAGARRHQAELRASLLAVVAFLDRETPG